MVLHDSPSERESLAIAFEVVGEPRAWERPGAMIRGHRIHWYVRAEEANYRKSIGWAAKAAMGARPPTRKPVAMLMSALLPIPTRWTIQQREDAHAGLIIPTAKPDGDNLLKLVADALTGIVYLDDAQVADWHCLKRYSAQPALRIEVREILSA